MKPLGILFGLFALFFSGSAMAIATPGENWQMNFFDAASPVMERIHAFHEHILLPIIVIITLFVLGLLIYVAMRFRSKRNPNPSKTTHHVLLEIVWTIFPVLILMMIAVPSLRLLFLQDRVPTADVTVKAVGYQWYWGYEYPESDVPEYSATMLCPQGGDKNGYDAGCVDDLKAKNLPHKLATDYPMVVPVDKNVRVLVTSMDVIHAWAMPALGVKKDAVPGRMNDTWFRATKEGTYYGQCSELCGVNHAFMPITLKVVSDEAYKAWLEFAKAGKLDDGNTLLQEYEKTGHVERLEISEEEKEKTDVEKSKETAIIKKSSEKLNIKDNVKGAE